MVDRTTASGAQLARTPYIFCFKMDVVTLLCFEMLLDFLFGRVVFAGEVCNGDVIDAVDAAADAHVA